MVSERQKKARNKWDSKNMVVLGCKVLKGEAEAFRAECKRRGTSPNAVFKQAINSFMAGVQQAERDKGTDGDT